MKELILRLCLFIKQTLLGFLGLDESAFSDPVTLIGLAASAAVIIAVIAVFIVLAATGRFRISKWGNKAWQRTKLITQSCFFMLTNSFMVGWFKGTIYQGKLKYLCVPGMNCYSCPGAWGACPIGSLQAIFNDFDAAKSWVDPKTGTYVKVPKYWFAFYVIGLMMLIGAVCGRFVCGLLCPFGWVQDLIYKIPVKKLRLPRDEMRIANSKHPKAVRFFLGLDKYLRYAKYAFLIVMVIFLPLLVKADPWFCKYVCPSGMLLGGIPLMSMNKSLADAAGSLTLLKLCILASLVVISIFLYRPFCRYICPLGAIYSFFNKVSLYRYGIDDASCNRAKGCAACAHACPMGVDPVRDPNSLECIRCGTCAASCPKKAIRPGFRFKTAEGNAIRTKKSK